MKALRILQVTRETAADRRFGIGRSLDPVVAALAERGHELRYLTQDDLGPRARERQDVWMQRLAPVARGLFGPAGEPMLQLWLERLNMGRLAAHLAAREGFDAVNLHDPWIGWGFRLARGWYGAGRCRWGVTQHGFGSYTEAIREEGVAYTPSLQRLCRWLERGVLRAADWVLCPTRAAREQLARDMALGEPPRHWQAVPHARPVLPLPTRADARARLGWADDECHVLAIGRINPVKRLDRVVEACLMLDRPLQLTLLAEGDATPLRRQVEAHAGTRLRLDVRVVDDVAPWLAAADVYVSAARNESFGLANLEALVAGLPAICTAVGGVPEVTGGAALLVPPDDRTVATALAQALRELLDDPARRARMAMAGRQRGGAWPDAAAVAVMHEAVYRGEAAEPVPGASPPRDMPPAAGAAVVASTAAADASGFVGTDDDQLCALPAPLPLGEARRVLVFAPHPDDETIGCGGALALLAGRADVAVRVVLVTDGAGAGGLPEGAAAVRQREFAAALARLGIGDHRQLGFADGGLAADAALRQAIETQIDDFAPDWIFGPSTADLHRDHRAVAAVLADAAVARPGVQWLCEYETWTPLAVTHVLGITAVLDAKLAALAEHRTALACGNYLEASEGLARYRALLLGAPAPGGAAEAYRCTRRGQHAVGRPRRDNDNP